MVKESNSTNAVENFVSSQGGFHVSCHLTITRNAKDYTYLYGNSLDDEESSLTRHLTSAFVEGAEECSLHRCQLTIE